MQYYHRKDIETQSGHTIAQWNFTPGLEMNLGSNDSNSSTVVTVVEALEPSLKYFAEIMAHIRIMAQSFYILEKLRQNKGNKTRNPSSLKARV